MIQQSLLIKTLAHVGFWNCSTLDFRGRDILFLSFVFQARELSDVRKETQRKKSGSSIGPSESGETRGPIHMGVPYL
jgi:hypothetical protein